MEAALLISPHSRDINFHPELFKSESLPPLFDSCLAGGRRGTSVIGFCAGLNYKETIKPLERGRSYPAGSYFPETHAGRGGHRFI